MKITNPARLLLAVVAILLSTVSLNAQQNTDVRQLCDSLSGLSKAIWKSKTDSVKNINSAKFYEDFEQVLRNPEYLDIPFDSIYGITRVADEANTIQIYTWNVPLSDGSFIYAGLVRLMKPALKVVTIKATCNENSTLATGVLPQSGWYGALYYKLIGTKIEGQPVYTLLGWDGSNAQMNRKVIDILTVNQNGELQFGLPVFNTPKGLQSRIVYEYAKQASMTLRYDKQKFAVAKKGRKKYKLSNLIVADHLVPMAANMEGVYKFYVPSGETYEGYYFLNNKWNFTDDVQVQVVIPKTKR